MSQPTQTTVDSCDHPDLVDHHRGGGTWELRGDGVGVVDVYETLEAGGGRVVSAHAQGYIVPIASVELPRPDVLLSPEFVWPDLPLSLHGFVLHRTGASDLTQLPRTVASCHGHVNVGRGQLVGEVHQPIADSGLTAVA